MTDIGGRAPGSLPNEAREIFEEGVAVPPVKIFRKGNYKTILSKSFCVTRVCRIGTKVTSKRYCRL